MVVAAHRKMFIAVGLKQLVLFIAGFLAFSMEKGRTIFLAMNFIDRL
ncbi:MULTISPECIES: hypothetical protein [Herbaspirillum]|nr:MULTISPECIES: hypothetical protein [Herbaspirillum]MDR6395757.1 hypothetical protein [Herbaspirillum seropedicae]